MMSTRLTVYLVHKDLNKIYTFRMFNEDFCCCSFCSFSTVDDWLQNHLKNHSYFNIEMKITFNDDNGSVNTDTDHVNKVCAKVLGAVTSRYGVIYPIEQFKSIRIIKQIIPWSTCLKKEQENLFRVLTRDEILVVEDMTGLCIL